MTPQSKDIVGSGGGVDQLDGTELYGVSSLKRRMFSVIATSVGRRSMLEAPKKPTMPARAVEDVLRVLGLGDRAAVAEHEHVGVDRARRRRASPGSRSTHSSSVCAVCAPIVPFVVRPMCGTSTSAPARGHRRGLRRRSKTYGAVSRPSSRGQADHLDLERVAHAGLLEVGAEGAVDQPDRREVLHARRSRRRSTCRRKPVHQPERVGAADAGEHRRVARRPAAPRAAMSSTIALASP